MRLQLIALFASTVLYTTPVQATPITYITSAVTSGQVLQVNPQQPPSSSFVDKLVTVSFTADTKDVQSYPGDIEVHSTPGSTTVTIEGYGTFLDLTLDPHFRATFGGDSGYSLYIDSVINPFNLDDEPFIWLNSDNPELEVWNGATSLGPLTLPVIPGTVPYRLGSIPTSIGFFRLESIAPTGTFQAILSPTSTSPVPEPSTLALLGPGAAGLIGILRRRQA